MVGLRHKIVTVNPEKLLFTHESISSRFHGSCFHANKSIYDAVEAILKGELDPSAFPKLEVVEELGKLWSQNNRRLWIFRTAKVLSIEVMVVQGQAVWEKSNFGRLRDNEALKIELMGQGFMPRVRGPPVSPATSTFAGRQQIDDPILVAMIPHLVLSCRVRLDDMTSISVARRRIDDLNWTQKTLESHEIYAVRVVYSRNNMIPQNPVAPSWETRIIRVIDAVANILSWLFKTIARLFKIIVAVLIFSVLVLGILPTFSWFLATLSWFLGIISRISG